MNGDIAYRFHRTADEFKGDSYIQWMLDSKQPTAFIVDRMRLLCLQREGGVYLDADCVAVRPLSSLDVFDDPKADFLFSMRSPDRLGVQLRGGISLVDNTCLGSAKNGRLIARLLELYHPNGKTQNGGTVGLHILRHMDTSTRVLNFRYIYGEQKYPESLVLHDSLNLGSWVKPR
ncbi:MAG TPA: glycosyltransferase [Terracidiphilus sp.]|nr:glycosyltransferase [Terracidiphilus sp.]